MRLSVKIPIALSVVSCILFGLQAVGHAKCTTVRIAYTDNWVPVAYDRGENKQLGFAPAIQKELFDRIGVQTEFLNGLPWNRQLRMLEIGEIDIMSAMHFNHQRATVFDYSDAFHDNNIHVYKRINSDLKYEKYEDLIPYRGLISLGASFGSEFDNYAKKNLNITRINGTSKIIQLLMNDRFDYMVLPRKLSDYLIRKYSAGAKIVRDGLPVAVKPVHMAFSRNSPCNALLKQVNAELEKMKSDGTLDKIVAREVLEMNNY